MPPQKQIESGHSMNVVSLALKSLKSHISFNSYTTSVIKRLSSLLGDSKNGQSSNILEEICPVHDGKDNEDVDQYDCMRLINKLGFVVL